MVFDILHKLYKIFVEAIFPTKCLVCGSFFPSPETDSRSAPSETGMHRQASGGTDPIPIDRLLSAYVCPVCIRGVARVESPICICCGLPFQSREAEDHYCGDCMRVPKKFGIARAPLVYDQTLMDVVHCFKYKGKIQLADPLGEMLLTAFGLFWHKNSIDVVVPVPLHWKRHQQRGFNQAYLLIQNWRSKAAACRIDADLRIERDVIVRKLPTDPQTGLGRRQRAANIKNAFGVQSAEKIINKTVLLVDDVYTTGATADACAQVLLAHGAAHVDVLTLARAI